MQRRGSGARSHLAGCSLSDACACPCLQELRALLQQQAADAAAAMAAEREAAAARADEAAAAAADASAEAAAGALAAAEARAAALEAAAHEAAEARQELQRQVRARWLCCCRPLVGCSGCPHHRCARALLSACVCVCSLPARCRRWCARSSRCVLMARWQQPPWQAWRQHWQLWSGQSGGAAGRGATQAGVLQLLALRRPWPLVAPPLQSGARPAGRPASPLRQSSSSSRACSTAAMMLVVRMARVLTRVSCCRVSWWRRSCQSPTCRHGWQQPRGEGCLLPGRGQQLRLVLPHMRSSAC